MISTRSLHMAVNHMALASFTISILAAHAGASKVHSPRCATWDSGHCVECYYGWFGSQCEETCTNCWTTGCYKGTGICVQCVPGRYGRHCNTNCPDKCRPDRDERANCDREGGRCQEGCREGWWGDTCNQTCSTNCKKGACLQINGDCIGDCRDGWHGKRCQKICSVGCVGNVCAWNTGKCQDGCKPGYFGETCENECGANCKDGECDMNGRCVKGCIGGFRGTTCHETCPINCLLCEQVTGSCTKCKTKWTGLSCTDRTPENGQSFPFPPPQPPDSSIGVACKTSCSNALLLLVSLMITLSTKSAVSYYIGIVVQALMASFLGIQKLLQLEIQRMSKIVYHGYTLVIHIFVNWRFQRPSISSVHPAQTS